MPKCQSQSIAYVLDTNILIHDPNAVLNFEEHEVVIPLNVLEELDRLKTGKSAIAADCRQAIRLIDRLLGNASPQQIEKGVSIVRFDKTDPLGKISILMSPEQPLTTPLTDNVNDNKIINALIQLKTRRKNRPTILVSKDINMRLKARACGAEAQDYHTDQLIDDIDLLPRGYLEFNHSFWDTINKVETVQHNAKTEHIIPLAEELNSVTSNDFIIDKQGFVGRVIGKEGDHHLRVLDLSASKLMQQETWGLLPRDIYQAIALHLLLDPEVYLVNLTGAAGSGKTILALAAAIEMTVASKRYKRIIVTRSTQGLDQDIGFLPGTEAEKMEPWLGAITDNLEALHSDDENMSASVEYILEKVPIQFKSLNYIRGRSFQYSLIIIDECQNLTPHQMKTIITRAGTGSKVICLGNLAQIDTAYLSAPSSGLTYLTERFKGFKHGGHIHLKGVPRSILAEFAEANL